MPLRNVMMGSTGPDVKAVQQGLNKHCGRTVLVDDGIFGTNTDRVVRRFQTEKKLAPDGIVGPITRSALFPLVGATINFWGQRAQRAPVPNTLSMRNPGGANLILGFGIPFPIPIPLPIPPGLLSGDVANDSITPAGATDPVPVPKVATPPGTRIVVEWQQISQTQRQFDGLFRNPQDSFAIGFQSVFKREQLPNSTHHLEIATGCLLQSPIGFQDAHGNDFTLACFAQATWVESLGQSGIFEWAPYAQAQGQGNLTGPANVTATAGGFPLNFNINLNKIRILNFDDVTLQLGAGVVGGLKFAPTGFNSSWGPQVGLGLNGKFSLFGGGP
ncbi:MAG TPA: peptidoglycan-binding domain-containing protein [Xanthobacteraceae bacterium]|nr:peptidoglycan-binding domain-containing protein [Xanthobacteraceae bacterium]